MGYFQIYIMVFGFLLGLFYGQLRLDFIEVEFENKDFWDKFYEIGMEMIIMKMGW